MPIRTPPASVLCGKSGLTTFSATGNFSVPEASAASPPAAMNRRLGVAMPYASRQTLPRNSSRSSAASSGSVVVRTERRGSPRCAVCAHLRVNSFNADAAYTRRLGASKHGTRAVSSVGSHADELLFESGTGDLRLEACTFQHSDLESGTGDILLDRASNLGALTEDLGVGSIRTVGD